MKLLRDSYIVIGDSKCYDVIMEKLSKNIRVCGICNKEYYRRGNRDFKTCSKECQSKYLSDLGAKEQYWKRRKNPPPGRVKNGTYKDCLNCSTSFYITPGKIDRAKFCKVDCKHEYYRVNGIMKGENNPLWKGGKRMMDGYVYLKKPEDINAMKGGYVAEHRMVMGNILGRKITKDEQIHHINGIKTDNRPENLEVVVKKMHYGHVVCPHCTRRFKVK